MTGLQIRVDITIVKIQTFEKKKPAPDQRNETDLVAMPLKKKLFCGFSQYPRIRVEISLIILGHTVPFQSRIKVSAGQPGWGYCWPGTEYYPI